LPIQQQIVDECQAVDDEVNAAKVSISTAKADIEQIIANVQGDKVKLGDVIQKVSDSIEPQTQTGLVNYVGLENIESNTGRLIGYVETPYQDIKSNKTVFSAGDILYGKLRPNLNKVYLSELDGICSTDILVFRINDSSLRKFYLYYFLSSAFNSEVLKSVSGQQLPRTSYGNMAQILIPKLSRELISFVTKIESLEAKIKQAQSIIDNGKARKEAVLKKYL
jgi:restriction endonuclease S subunit